MIEHVCNAVGDTIKIESDGTHFRVNYIAIFATCAPGIQVNDFIVEVG